MWERERHVHRSAYQDNLYATPDGDLIVNPPLAPSPQRLLLLRASKLDFGKTFKCRTATSRRIAPHDPV
jgi:hypothetical protein